MFDFVRLFEKQKQYEEACDKIDLFEAQAADAQTNIKNLEEMLDEKVDEIDS